MQLTNVTDEIVRTEHSQMVSPQPILTKIAEFPLIVQKIIDGPNDPIDLILHKEMALAKNLLEQSANAEVPFMPYVLKAQKKKITTVAYKTHSQSPPSPSQ